MVLPTVVSSTLCVDSLYELAIYFWTTLSSLVISIAGARNYTEVLRAGLLADVLAPVLCRTGGWSELSASDALYRHTTPQDRGILSLTEEDAHLLTVRDLQSMVPSLSQRPRA